MSTDCFSLNDEESNTKFMILIVRNVLCTLTEGFTLTEAFSCNLTECMETSVNTKRYLAVICFSNFLPW